MELKSTTSVIAKWTLVGPMGPQVPSFLLNNTVLAVDGGALYTPKIDVWIGDSDSFSGQPSISQCHLLPQEKSKSDLGHALDLLAHMPNLELHFWGFLGGRRDHEVINFGEVIHFSKSKEYLMATFYGPRGRIEAKICSQGSWRFEHVGIFSIISLEEMSLQIMGNCKYLLEKPQLIKPFSSQTLSNASNGLFDIISDKPFIILFNDED